MTDNIIIAVLIVVSCTGWSLFIIARKMYEQVKDERDDARALAEYYASLHSDLKATALVRGPDGRIRKA